MTIQYKAGYKYQLWEDYSIPAKVNGLGRRTYVINPNYIKLSKGGSLIIRQGYAWDGPSGPAIDTKSFMRGSLVHDALYQLIRTGRLGQEYREKADRLLQQMCIEDGMWRIRAWWVYKSLRWFGGAASDPENKRPVITAP